MKYIRICAWCGRLVEENGKIGRKVSKWVQERMVGKVSHTCCKNCKSVIDKDIKLYKQEIQSSVGQR